EDYGFVARRTIPDRRVERGADIGRDFVGCRVRVAGRGDLDAAQVAVLIVVAVPAAVGLLETDGENRAALVRDRLGDGEDGVPGDAAAAGAGVSGPGGFVFAVEGERERADDALLVALVVEHLFERALGRVEVGGGRAHFDAPLFLGVASGS